MDSGVREALGERLRERDATAQRARRLSEQLGNVRLGLAALTLVVVVLPVVTREGYVWWLLVPLFLFFFVLGKFQERALARTRRFEAAAQFFRGSLDRLDERWRDFADDGEDLASMAEDLSYAKDLDLFGPASLFQLLNRAGTAEGRRTLATWLLAAESVEEVRLRQEAVQELAARLDFREGLAASAARESASPLDDARLLAWAEAKEGVPFAAVLKTLGAVQPLILGVALGVYGVLDIGAPLAIVGVLHLITIYATRGFVNTRAAVLSGPEAVLGAYGALVDHIEGSDWKSLKMQAAKKALALEGESAGDRIRSLSRLVALLDARLNVFFALTFGAFFLWNINWVLRSERWRRTTGPKLRSWLAAIAEVEALASFAALLYERPDYAFPAFVEDGGAHFEAEALSHPLIHRDQVVANDLLLGGEGSVLLLSGSNMSGKSTLLRSIGINVLLAQAGAPVSARGLRLSPFSVVTSVRIVDSLASGTSHFYAEIKRIKALLDASEQEGPFLLYLLDEMLHGTNSRERYLGALAVVKALSERGAVGVVSTHDLALAKLADKLPSGMVENRHFSDEVVENGIRFDYRLRPGPIASTNALRLMRSIGIVLDFEEESGPTMTTPLAD